MDKEKLKAMHIGFPRNYIALSRGFTSSHKGVDMCWNSKYGGSNAPVYAPADGTVTAICNTKGNTASKGKGDWGNYVKIKHATGVYTLMAHLKKGSVCVKVNQKVSRGQQVALMNNSGYSFGSHVHFELYNGGSGTSYRVNPLLYCYAYPNDIVNASTDKEYGILHYSPIEYWGTPVERNSLVDQVKVITKTLRARKTAGLDGEILGYANTGIYDVHGITEKDGYTWYNIEDFWVANNRASTYCEFLPKTEPHYNLTMKSLSEAQKQAMEAWCKGEEVDYTVEEV